MGSNVCDFLVTDGKGLEAGYELDMNLSFTRVLLYEILPRLRSLSALQECLTTPPFYSTWLMSLMYFFTQLSHSISKRRHNLTT